MKNNNKPITERRLPEGSDGGADLPPAPSPKFKDISELADVGCKKCDGTGNLGRYTEGKYKGRWVPCPCVRKNVFEEALKISREEHERKVRMKGVNNAQ